MKVLYFGILSEITGQPQEEFSLEGTVGDLRKLITEKYPEIAKQSYQVAVDQQIAQEDQSVTSAVEVALLPPFTGG